jgi:hypothetical protein
MSRIPVALLLISLAGTWGCSSARALRGSPGIDLSPIDPGLQRRSAEQILGPPEREWVTSADIRYCVYRYDAGVPPSRQDAAAFFFLNVISAGLFEVYEATGVTHLSRQSADYPGRIRRQMAIAYDRGGSIVGAFDDFSDLDPLPDDGRR